MTVFIYLLAALAAGTVLAVQPLVNARLAMHLGHGVLGALGSVIVSVLLFSVATLVFRIRLPSWSTIGATPVWLWAGGAMGALYLLIALSVAPRLGIATTSALFIAGQLAASTIIDHYGLFGLDPRPADAQRLVGIALLMAGVLLVRGL